MEMGGGQVPPGGGQVPPGGGQYGPGQPVYPQQPQQPPTQQYQGGGGVADVAQTVQRAVRTPETKPFFLTSEFLVWLLTVIGFGYIISRGISKAGTKYRGNGGSGGGPGGY